MGEDKEEEERRIEELDDRCERLGCDGVGRGEEEEEEEGGRRLEDMVCLG